jgi:hypothetical protein
LAPGRFADSGAWFSRRSTFDASDAALTLIHFRSAKDQGAFAVDLALRLNVLAAFVALAFVGAILFGAF